MIPKYLLRRGICTALFAVLLIPAASAQKKQKSGPRDLGKHATQVSAITWMRRGEQLVTGTEGGVITCFDAKTGDEIFSNNDEKTPVLMLAATRDNKTLMCGRQGASGMQRIDPTSGKAGAVTVGHEDQKLSVGSFDPNGRWIFTGSTDGIVERVSMDAAAEGADRHLSLTVDCGKIRCMAASPDGKTIVVTGEEPTLHILRVRAEITAGQPATGHSGPINCIDFDSRGAMFATGSDDKSVRLWSARGRHVRTLEGHPAVVTAVDFGRNGRVLASGYADGVVKIWDLKTFTYMGELQVKGGGAIHAIAFSPDGKQLAAAAGKKQAVIWDVSGY